jgi:hypothetical protein
VWHTWGRRNICRGLVEKSEGKGELGRPEVRKEHNIEMDMKGIGLD